MKLRFDSGALRLGGWAAPTEAEHANDPLNLGLVIGPVFLGTLRRDQPRPDVEAHLGFSGPPSGFGIADYGLAAFARVCELGDIAITVDGSEHSTERYPLPVLDTERPHFAPLTTRHGIGKLVRLVDIWLEGRRNLNLRFEGSPKVPKSVDGYQRKPGGALVKVAADRPINGLTSIVAMSLVNPFAPLLLVFKGEDNAIDAIDFLPFPSLVRGGMHCAERLIGHGSADDVADTASASIDLFAALLQRFERPANCVGVVELDPAVHTGLEPALDEDLLNWMSEDLSVGVRLGASADKLEVSRLAAERVERCARTDSKVGHILQVPADSIPTIAALVNGLPEDVRPETLTGGMGVTDWNRHGHVWSIWQPPFCKGFEGLQLSGAQRAAPMLTIRPQGGERADRKAQLTWPLALAFRQQRTQVAGKNPFETAAGDESPLLYAAASSNPAAISALIIFDPAKSSPLPLLESLARQEGAKIAEVIVCRPHGEKNTQLVQALGRLFKGRHSIIGRPTIAGRLEQIAAGRGSISGETVLILDAATVLPDYRFLATLQRMLAVPDVASVGCLLRAADEEMTPLAAGYSLSGVSLRSLPTVMFDAIDPAVWRGPTTYPVIANSLSALVTRASSLKGISAHGSSALRPETDDLLFGIQLIEGGGINLCSTIVSAFSASRSRASNLGLTLPYRISPESLARIAESSTLVQRIA